jgi:extracellular factor (EF) 3-hydroxypalmitic acid methyl ester biosynthesis protein
MENKLTPLGTGEKTSFIVCRNSQGSEVRATLLRLTRYLVVFEVYNPYSIVQLSEVLSDFRIIINERILYSGRAVVSNLVNTGLVLICEATLDESWLDIDVASPVGEKERLRSEYFEFVQEWEKIHQVIPEFKVVVADIQTLFVDLRRWMEQVELRVRSQPSGDRLQTEREVIQDLQEPVFPTITPLIERFEAITESQVPEGAVPVHRTYIKRQLHPLVLCAPFVFRTFQKPLGYAGDYEMVNMMLRDPLEGSSMFAKLLNNYFLHAPPVVAHRNRIQYLTHTLSEETLRIARKGKFARVFNFGCGPAKEVQDFLTRDDLSDRAHFTLLDFNEETLDHTGRLLDDAKMRYRRTTQLRLVKKSVHQLLKEASRPNKEFPPNSFDLVYCAGLFDYFSDRICKRLMNIFYDLLAPGGLLVATNVDSSNPSRNWMEFVVDWHLVYRNAKQLESLRPDAASTESYCVRADKTGVNIFVEVRKPAAP